MFDALASSVEHADRGPAASDQPASDPAGRSLPTHDDLRAFFFEMIHEIDAHMENPRGQLELLWETVDRASALSRVMANLEAENWPQLKGPRTELANALVDLNTSIRAVERYRDD